MDNEHKPGDLINDPNNPEVLQKFLDSANTEVTAEINATRIEADIYLARTISESAKASEKYAKGLRNATWALFSVSFLLFLIAAIEMIMYFCAH